MSPETQFGREIGLAGHACPCCGLMVTAASEFVPTRKGWGRLKGVRLCGQCVSALQALERERCGGWIDESLRKAVKAEPKHVLDPDRDVCVQCAGSVWLPLMSWARAHARGSMACPICAAAGRREVPVQSVGLRRDMEALRCGRCGHAWVMGGLVNPLVSSAERWREELRVWQRSLALICAELRRPGVGDQMSLQAGQQLHHLGISLHLSDAWLSWQGSASKRPRSLVLRLPEQPYITA